MGKVYTGFERAKVTDLHAGSLILAPTTLSLGIVTRRSRQSGEEHVQVILLSEPNISHALPTLKVMHFLHDDHVLNYGKDWLLEVRGDPVLCQPGAKTPIGTITSGLDGHIIYLDVESDQTPGQRSFARLSLQTNQTPSHPPQPDDVHFSRWRLWLNEADMKRPGAAPFIEFDASPPSDGGASVMRAMTV